MKTLALFAFWAAFLGCIAACNPVRPTQPPGVPVSAVIDELKYELALFKQDSDGKILRYLGGPRCGGNGTLSMKVAAVGVKLTTDFNKSSELDASLSTPIGGGVVTLGPSGGLTETFDNTQTISLNFVPVDSPSNVVADPKRTYPLARALMGVRDALLAVAPGGQCLAFDTNADNASSVTLAFTAERDVTDGVKLNIVVLALDASHTEKVTFGNTITVTLDFKGSTAEIIRPATH